MLLKRNFKQLLVQLFHSATTVNPLFPVFVFQVQTLKVLVNLSSNPDMMDDIVQAQVRTKIAGVFFFSPAALCNLKYTAWFQVLWCMLQK